MKKNFKVLQIKGFRGMLFTIFMTSCIISGFVAFPAFMLMNIWNYFSTQTAFFPLINFGQGVLLWAIIVFSIIVFSKKMFIVSFNAQQELSEDEVKDVMSKIKSQGVNHGILLPKDVNILTKTKEELKEIPSEQNKVK